VSGAVEGHFRGYQGIWTPADKVWFWKILDRSRIGGMFMTGEEEAALKTLVDYWIENNPVEEDQDDSSRS
jgi:hypothetical protein